MASMMMSDAVSEAAPSSRYGMPAATPRNRVNSNSRPRGPMSESVGPQSDDEGFADDQIPTGSRRPKRNDAAIPRVEDTVGLYVQNAFENFLETYVSHSPIFFPRLIIAGSLKTR